MHYAYGVFSRGNRWAIHLRLQDAKLQLREFGGGQIRRLARSGYDEGSGWDAPTFAVLSEEVASGEGERIYWY
jgi:hypothetical protein